MESPAATSIALKDSQRVKQFNLLMNYRFDADIFLSYVGRGTLSLLLEKPLMVNFTDKSETPLGYVIQCLYTHTYTQCLFCFLFCFDFVIKYVFKYGIVLIQMKTKKKKKKIKKKIQKKIQKKKKKNK